MGSDLMQNLGIETGGLNVDLEVRWKRVDRNERILPLDLAPF